HGELTLQTKIAAQDQALMLERWPIHRDGRSLRDGQWINAGVGCHGLRLKEIASGQVSESDSQAIAQLRCQVNERFPMRVAGDAKQDDKKVGLADAGNRLSGQIGRDLNVFQVELQCR